ncbi:DUF1559 domain-containing protein [Thermogutta sp.]|uniref:DUF1559 family PulG-like putative transporter n=1 Tax=Thermogutta sp. TaxID=1962930 RepID=UPI003C7ECE45
MDGDSIGKAAFCGKPPETPGTFQPMAKARAPRWTTRATPQDQRGMTQIELWCVVLIIGTLISLLLPAVQACREIARSAQCQHQLLQLGLAIRNYETIHGRFPAGVVEPSGPVRNVPIGYHHNWLIAVVPWIDPVPGRMIRADLSVYDSKNLAILGAKAGYNWPLLCPSSVYRGISPSYAGRHGEEDKPIDESDHGVFVRNRFFRVDEITDGCGHTIFLGEKLPLGLEWGWLSGTRATLRNAGLSLEKFSHRTAPRYESYSVTTEEVIRIIQNPEPEDVQRFWTSCRGDRDIREVLPNILAHIPEGPPTTPEVKQSLLEILGSLPEGGPIIGGFGSAHPGGVNFLFGDLSARKLRFDIEQKVLKSLAHRSDGEGTDDALR